MSNDALDKGAFALEVLKLNAGPAASQKATLILNDCLDSLLPKKELKKEEKKSEAK